jgi:hypothetical protein
MPQRSGDCGDDGRQAFNEELLRSASRAIAREIGADPRGGSLVTPTVTRAQYETAEKRLNAKIDSRMLQLLRNEV